MINEDVGGTLTIEDAEMLEVTDKRECRRTLINEDAGGTLINKVAGEH